MDRAVEVWTELYKSQFLSLSSAKSLPAHRMRTGYLYICMCLSYRININQSINSHTGPRGMNLNLNLNGLLVTRQIDNTSPGVAPGGKLVPGMRFSMPLSISRDSRFTGI